MPSSGSPPQSACEHVQGLQDTASRQEQGLAWVVVRHLGQDGICLHALPWTGEHGAPCVGATSEQA